MWGLAPGGIKTVRFILLPPTLLIYSPSIGVVAKTLIFSEVSEVTTGCSSTTPQDTNNKDIVNKVILKIYFKFIIISLLFENGSHS